MSEEERVEIQAETPPPPPEPAPEPDETVQPGEVALPGEGKVRVVRPEPYAEEETKDRKDRVELA